MAARNAGAPARALLIGPGKLSDQNGTRELLSSTSAKMIEADLQGTTLAVSGDGISDFRAYAPQTTALRINGQLASGTLVDGVVIYPALPPPPPDGGDSAVDGGTFIDGGSPDGGAIPDAGVGAPPTLTGSFPHGGWGCATGGGAALCIELAAALGLAALRRRRPRR